MGRKDFANATKYSAVRSHGSGSSRSQVMPNKINGSENLSIGLRYGNTTVVLERKENARFVSLREKSIVGVKSFISTHKLFSKKHHFSQSPFVRSSLFIFSSKKRKLLEKLDGANSFPLKASSLKRDLVYENRSKITGILVVRREPLENQGEGRRTVLSFLVFPRFSPFFPVSHVTASFPLIVLRSIRRINPTNSLLTESLSVSLFSSS